MKNSPTVFADDAEWTIASRAGRVFGEGVVAAKDGLVYLSDITITTAMAQGNPGGTIWRYDPATGACEKFLEPSGMSNGLHVDKHGDLLIAQGADTGGRAVMRCNLATRALSVVARDYRGKRFNAPNDLTSDAFGRVYFTDPRFFGAESMELPNAVYRVDTDGSVTPLDVGVERPNGIEVSPDGRRLYVNTSNAPRLTKNPHGPAADAWGITSGGVVAFDLDAAGAISNGRVVFRNEDLLTDGMAMDSDGNLYIAMHNGNPAAPASDLAVIDPDGAVLARKPLPDRALATNLGFGRGADAHTLYASSALPWGLWRITTLRSGHCFE
jgi:gluconolactonase